MIGPSSAARTKIRFPRRLRNQQRRPSRLRSSSRRLRKQGMFRRQPRRKLLPPILTTPARVPRPRCRLPHPRPIRTTQAAQCFAVAVRLPRASSPLRLPFLQARRRPPLVRPRLVRRRPVRQWWALRQAAYAYSSTLPNFMAQQLTTRYRTENIRQGWDTIDVVSADVAYENGQESYRNIKVGSRSVQSMDALGGTRSTGEFSSQLQDLMSPATGAGFRRDGTDTLHGRAAIVYSLDVPRERSHWRVEAPSQLYYPAYKGSIWVDRETSRVLRIELQARNLPSAFPFDTVESATDYDFIRLMAESEYLLPANAEVLSCERGTSFCSRNRIEFRNYRKFDAASSISFDK
jgi:hypothetical protein